METKKNALIKARIDGETKRRFDEACKIQNTTPPEWVRSVITAFVKRTEKKKGDHGR
jgi:antitoxin component of RelBE/YafQ-DinJ toxin-antitoxin module